MNKCMSLLVSMAAAAVVAGCASIINGTSEQVTINSNVKGATVQVAGGTVGVTPFTGPIPRGAGTTLIVSKEGYESKTITLNTEIEPIFWGNIIIGGVFGSTTDMATGAMYKFAPATIQVDLERAGGK